MSQRGEKFVEVLESAAGNRLSIQRVRVSARQLNVLRVLTTLLLTDVTLVRA